MSSDTEDSGGLGRFGVCQVITSLSKYTDTISKDSGREAGHWSGGVTSVSVTAESDTPQIEQVAVTISVLKRLQLENTTINQSMLHS